MKGLNTLADIFKNLMKFSGYKEALVYDFNKAYNKLCQKAKILHYHNKFREAGNNMREGWSIIRDALGTPRKGGNLPGFFKEGKNKVRNDRDIANGFNTFFSTIGTKLDTSLNQSNTGHKHYLNKQYEA